MSSVSIVAQRSCVVGTGLGLLVFFLVSACQEPQVRSQQPERAGKQKTNKAKETTMGDPIRLRETTNVIVAGHEVAPMNIFERTLGGPDGVMRERMSARLSIMERSTRKEWNQTIIEGDLVKLGEETYRVVSIEPTPRQPGWVTLQRVAD